MTIQNPSRADRIAIIAIETYGILQLQLQLIREMATVLEKLDPEPPEAVAPIAMQIHQRMQELVPYIAEEMTLLNPDVDEQASQAPDDPQPSDTDSPEDIFGL